jgi:hypothetical protein
MIKKKKVIREDGFLLGGRVMCSMNGDLGKKSSKSEESYP